VHAAGLDRKDVYITTKCFNDDHGFEQAKRALRASLDQLEMDFVDLYLIHWPVPSRDRYVACSTSTCAPRRCRRSQHSIQASGRARTPRASTTPNAPHPPAPVGADAHERSHSGPHGPAKAPPYAQSRLRSRQENLAGTRPAACGARAESHRMLPQGQPRGARVDAHYGRTNVSATILSRSAWVGGTRCRVGGACAASLNASLM